MRKKRVSNMYWWWITSLFMWIYAILPIMVARGEADECPNGHYDPARGECRLCRGLCESPLEKRIVLCLAEPKCKAFWPARTVTTPLPAYTRSVTTPPPAYTRHPVRTPPPVSQYIQQITTPSTSLSDKTDAQDGLSPLLVAFIVLVAVAIVGLPLLYVAYKKGWLVKLLKPCCRRPTEVQEDPEIAQPLHREMEVFGDQQVAARPNELLPVVDDKHPIQVEAQHSEAESSLVTSRTVTTASERIEDTQVKSVM